MPRDNILSLLSETRSRSTGYCDINKHIVTNVNCSPCLLNFKQYTPGPVVQSVGSAIADPGVMSLILGLAPYFGRE